MSAPRGLTDMAGRPRTTEGSLPRHFQK